MESELIDAIANVLDALSWPLTAIIAAFAFIKLIPKFAEALKKAPFIKKLTFPGFEVELNLNDLNEIQDQTDKALVLLIKKSDKETQRLVELSALEDTLRLAGDRLYALLPKTEEQKASGKMRCTAHIYDPVFSEYLYQACN